MYYICIYIIANWLQQTSIIKPSARSQHIFYTLPKYIIIIYKNMTEQNERYI